MFQDMRTLLTVNPFALLVAWFRAVNAMPSPTQAEQNIAACRKALEGFWPIATPQLMRELTEAVDRHEDAVRKANNLPPREP